MLTVLVLICSLAITPELRDCNRDNAVRVAEVPEKTRLPIMCQLYGQQFIAATSFGQEIAADEAVKVLCIKSENRPANVG